MDRRSRIHGGKLGGGAPLQVSRVARVAMDS